MSAPLDPAAFEGRLSDYVYERSEEARAVRVGEKESSEQAAIVLRYSDLFTRPQLDLLREAEADDDATGGERLFRLREACRAGLIASELAERSDALENAVLATTVARDGDELPLRAAQARLAVIDDYDERDALGAAVVAASAGLNEQRLDLLAAEEQLDAELSGEPDPVKRSADLKLLDLGAVAAAVRAASALLDDAHERARATWLDRVFGPVRDPQPTSAHVPYLRRLSPLATTYTRERSVPVCLGTLEAVGLDLHAYPSIRLDLDDRPQKNPRACVIASRPPEVVHLITRAQGGLSDYQAFLHEAGHAFHYAGADTSLPYAFRRLSRDHALTEIYSFTVESVTREPDWHETHFELDAGVARENARGASFIELLLFRRYTAKLTYELEFWSHFAEASTAGGRYAELVSEATGFRYPASGYLADMDGGFYSADYLRAWIRAAQLRASLRERVGDGWWRSPATGDILRELFAEGTRPTSEEIAARLGCEPLDAGPLVSELLTATQGV
ncbi:MAG: hypothetical protein ACE5EV_03410 [Gaiellales bacterium]